MFTNTIMSIKQISLIHNYKILRLTICVEYYEMYNLLVCFIWYEYENNC